MMDHLISLLFVFSSYLDYCPPLVKVFETVAGRGFTKMKPQQLSLYLI